MARDHGLSEGHHLEVRFFQLPDDLAGCFSTVYCGRIALPHGTALVDHLLPEWSNARFFFTGAPEARMLGDQKTVRSDFQITGPTSRPVRFEIGSSRFFGFGMLPLGWQRFVGEPADEFADTLYEGRGSKGFAAMVPLFDLLAAEIDDEARQFAAFCDFFRHLEPEPRDAARTSRIYQAMLDPHVIEVRALADASGLTVRTLERICKRHFGFAPRLLLRRQRLIRSLAAFMLAEGKSWTEVIDGHYHDQAHFVHEFHSFMGMSPSDYLALGHPVLEAFFANRQEVWGMPARKAPVA